MNPGLPATVTVGDGTLGSVTLTSSDGSTVAGQMSADGTTWTATSQLGYKRSYTLTASRDEPGRQADDADGEVQHGVAEQPDHALPQHPRRRRR